MEADGPAQSDPAELLLYALEYMEMYILFAFKSEDPHESDLQTAVSYLGSTLDLIEDARAALAERPANPPK